MAGGPELDVAQIIEAGIRAEAMAVHNEKEAVRIGGLWLQVRQSCAHAIKQYRYHRQDAIKNVEHWKKKLDTARRSEDPINIIEHFARNVDGWHQQSLCWLNAITVLRGFLKKARP